MSTRMLIPLPIRGILVKPALKISFSFVFLESKRKQGERGENWAGRLVS